MLVEVEQTLFLVILEKRDEAKKRTGLKSVQSEQEYRFCLPELFLLTASVCVVVGTAQLVPTIPSVDCKYSS